MRLPTRDESKHLSVHGLDKDWKDQHHLEEQIVLLIKLYHGIPVDTSAFTLLPDVESAFQFLMYLYDIYNRMMYKIPIMSDMQHHFAWLNLHGLDISKVMVKSFILEQNEFKYQSECLDTLLSWSSPSLATTLPEGQIRVRLYVPYGTSGYATAARNIVRSLAMQSNKISLSVVPLTVQEFNPLDDNEDNQLLASLLEAQDPETIREANFPGVDVVIIHSVPDLWKPIVSRELSANPGVKTIGMTVWETDDFPIEWLAHFYGVDRVIFPNRWNVQSLSISCPGIQAEFVPHPVTITPPTVESTLLPIKLEELLALKSTNPNLYVFYSINEFSGRKGLDMLMKAYVEEFHGATQDTVLFIKTHGAVKEDVALALLENFTKGLDRPPRVILEYKRWHDRDIHRLHQESHCFISLTRSEGHGLGACQAALMGKRVIMTGYGGQMDYLEGIDWVPYTLTPATFCSLFEQKHGECLNDCSCYFFRFFVPTHQQWGLPDETEARRLMRQAFRGRLSGVSRTVQKLVDIASLSTVGTAFVQCILDVLNPDSFARVSLSHDVYTLPDSHFRPQRQVLSAYDVSLTSLSVKSRKPKVVAIGCYFYGNLGDDLYSVMHKTHLGDEFDLRLCNTQTFVSSDGTLKHLSDYQGEEDLEVPEYVIVGGGGILNESELSSSILRVYLPFCRKYNIPLSVLSVGCTFDDRTRTVSQTVLDGFRPLLEYADLVTVRSLADRDAVLSVIPTTRHPRVRVLPDLVFGIPSPSLTPRILGPYIVFCPTTYCSVQTPDIAVLLQKKLWEHPGSRLVYLPLDGIGNVDIYPGKFVIQERERLKVLFSDVILFPGRFISGPFLDLIGVSPPSNSIDQTTETYVNILKHARCIVTGRYHGLVLGKRFCVPVETGHSSIMKITEELDSPLDHHAAWPQHYEWVKREIRCSLVSREEVSDPVSWDEDTRNTAIVDDLTQTPPPAWSETTEYVQALNNIQLWTRRKSVLAARCTHYQG